MKKSTLLVLSFVLIAACSVFYFADFSKSSEPSMEELRAMHQYHLDNSPFKENAGLFRDERKALGLPPNGYNEQVWELTFDPQTGRPMPERAAQLQAALKIERENNRGVGGDANNPWVNRTTTVDLSSTGHPAGGRTRGIMFDPNDGTAKRVFAGGVSGGLWVNNDITDVNASWTLVPGIGANIAVTVIISDPNNSNTFYIGSGESYTSGDAIGNGIWKSTDAGVTWSNIFGGYIGVTGTQFIDGIFYINDLVARDIGGGNTELYAAVAGAFHAFSSSDNQWHGLYEQGLYKSVDDGSNWTKFTFNEANGSPSNPNDIEIDINNNIWFTTTRSSWGYAGGKIYRSTDGTSFTLMHTVAGADRTEIETSAASADELWIAANVPGGTQQADLFYTNDAFATAPSALAEPNDADNGIPASDFTRGQAYYDLEIEADASGNLYVGGVDLFRSTDNGTTWTQISKWSNNAMLNTLPVSLVHADQHAIVFRPGNDNQMVFGTDGGIYYSNDISMASSSATIDNRNKDYSTIQFYYGAIDVVDGADGDDIFGGAQDNGTSYILDGAAGANIFTDAFGGDGAFTELHRANGYGIQTYTGNGHRYFNYPVISNAYTIASGSGGNFINEAGLDRNLDILYSNASTSTPLYRIERNATFTGGVLGITRTILTDALLNAEPSAFKVDPYTPATTKLWVGLTNGRLLRIDNADGGVAPTWNLMATFVGSISDIEYGVTNMDMFATVHNYGVTSVWASSDGGSSWSSIEGDLPDVPVKCVLQNPLYPNQVIIGTALGVWATNDYTVVSPTWIQTYNGMSDVPVLDLDLRPSDNVILASTYGRGMFTSQFTASNSLSITENSLKAKGITVFPTVNDGNFNIVAKNNIGNVSLQIYNITGQLVHDSKFNLSNTKKGFNLNLNSGIYFVQIKGETISGTQKIIVK